MPRPLWLPCRGPARARASREIPGNETDLEINEEVGGRGRRVEPSLSEVAVAGIPAALERAASDVSRAK